MNKENNKLWIEVNDASASDEISSGEQSARDPLFILSRVLELRAEEEAAAVDDEAISTVKLYAEDLREQGLSPKDISQKVIEKLTKVTPHLTPERNDYPPYDVSVERGTGWGTVVYFDEESRLGRDHSGR